MILRKMIAYSRERPCNSAGRASRPIATLVDLFLLHSYFVPRLIHSIMVRRVAAGMMKRAAVELTAPRLASTSKDGIRTIATSSTVHAAAQVKTSTTLRKGECLLIIADPKLH